jgi:NADH-quinone oxidoreductase subunit J
VTDPIPQTINAIPFAILAIATLGGTIAMLMSKNVVHAAFWVLEVMVATAGLFLLLSAEFLALVQLLVYAGAVAVLILFTIMLTLRRREDAVRSLDFSLPALGIAVAFGAAAVAAIGGFHPTPSAMPATTPGVKEFGELLFKADGGWGLPFEIASVVLLVALIGAVLWAGGDEGR